MATLDTLIKAMYERRADRLVLNSGLPCVLQTGKEAIRGPVLTGEQVRFLIVPLLSPSSDAVLARNEDVEFSHRSPQGLVNCCIRARNGVLQAFISAIPPFAPVKCDDARTIPTFMAPESWSVVFQGSPHIALPSEEHEDLANAYRENQSLLQAKHGTAMTAAAVGIVGLNVAVGVATGGASLVAGALNADNYKTLAHAHQNGLWNADHFIANGYTRVCEGVGRAQLSLSEAVTCLKKDLTLPIVKASDFRYDSGDSVRMVITPQVLTCGIKWNIGIVTLWITPDVYSLDTVQFSARGYAKCISAHREDTAATLEYSICKIAEALQVKHRV